MNKSSTQILAKYIILGADLRELWENWDTPNAKQYLSDILDEHDRFLKDEWKL
jgi:hypothetical protein